MNNMSSVEITANITCVPLLWSIGRVGRRICGGGTCTVELIGSPFQFAAISRGGVPEDHGCAVHGKDLVIGFWG
jgi:hypothetical protein